VKNTPGDSPKAYVCGNQILIRAGSLESHTLLKISSHP
jgi:hypothetical protein